VKVAEKDFRCRTTQVNSARPSPVAILISHARSCCAKSKFHGSSFLARSILVYSKRCEDVADAFRGNRAHRTRYADAGHEETGPVGSTPDLSAGICPSRFVQTMTGSGSPVARHCSRTTDRSDTVMSRGLATITGRSTHTHTHTHTCKSYQLATCGQKN